VEKRCPKTHQEQREETLKGKAKGLKTTQKEINCRKKNKLHANRSNLQSSRIRLKTVQLDEPKERKVHP
jgi:hypothetical protein